jgi:hypothetical protein
MHRVEEGCVLLEADICICGDYICAPCSLSFGSEEGIFGCLKHVEVEDADVVDSDDDNNLVEKEVVKLLPSQRNNGSQVAAKGVKSGSK